MNILGFSNGSVDKESACNARDLGLIPRSERPLEWGGSEKSCATIDFLLLELGLTCK